MFHVASAIYAARITDEPLAHDGEPCLGLCDGGRRLILISCEVAIDRRLHVLLHELCHAHFFEAGMPGDDEGLCDAFAGVAELAFRDLALNGGEEALKRLRPGETFGRLAGRIGLLRHRCCPCGETVAGGSVYCTPDAARPGEVTLKLYCEFCNHTLTWNEFATFGGGPSSVPTGEQRVEKGDHVTHLLGVSADV